MVRSLTPKPKDKSLDSNVDCDSSGELVGKSAKRERAPFIVKDIVFFATM
jgi:hypothetical protein